ncbi:ABC transporter ATP-binding protein [Treponema sp.]|uniref:ABC transporter ATP-binding protein n=1 Tax=Treponema sp. TaxID=166 RepID=UPI003EFED002
MSDQKIILSIKNLEKVYRTSGEELSILKKLNMELCQGQICVVVGKSGSGKSTLLNIIGGLDKASGGTVCAGGLVVNEMSEKQLVKFRRNFLGMIFQFHYLLKDFTALENVFLPALMAGMSKKQASEKAESLLEAVGMKDRMYHLPSELSGGERQRVAVARSLVNDPELILADEPTGNLDPASAETVGNLLFSLSREYGKTLILVTHDMNLAAKGQVRYLMENGQLRELGV